MIIIHAWKNKRTSTTLGAFFLELNGLDSIVSKFIIEMENISAHVADKKIEKEILFEIIQSLIYEEEYPEELELKIIYTLTRED